MRAYILIFLIVFSSVTSNSQNKLNFGIKTGYINSWQTLNEKGRNTIIRSGGSEITHHRNSISIGGFIDWELSKMLSLEGDVLYSNKGYITDVTFTSYDIEKLSYKLNYIDIPILIKVRFLEKNCSPFFSAGYVSSVNVYQQIVTTFQQPFIYRANVYGYYGSLLFTSGININHFILEARYAPGLTNYFYINRSLLSSFSVLVGYNFK